jgi:outer membrane protein assembly factor BamA
VASGADFLLPSTISLDAERGLYLASELTHHVDATHNQYSFTRLTVDAQQYVPLEKEAMHGLALRQFASFTRAPGGQEVPFYRLQSLGGSRSLRGYYTDRFRDRNVLLLNAEVRCHVWHWLDMALFTDAGHVFRDANELGLEGIRYDVGIGFRVRANNKTLGRFEIARSPEGLVTHLELGSLL